MSEAGTPAGATRALAELVEIAVIVLAAALAVLVLGEIATRVLDRDGGLYDVEMFRYSRLLKRDAPPDAAAMHHWHIPGASAVLQRVPVAINSRGLRDYEYDYPVPAGVTRILVLGDSVTLGWGVPLDDTYPKVLERELNGGARKGRFEVLNGGVGNYTTSRIIGLYEHELYKYDPSVVVFAFYLNNAKDDPDSRWRFVFETPLEFPVFLWSRLQGVMAHAGLAPSFDDYYRDLYAEGSPSYARFRDDLSRFLRDLRAEGKTVVVASLPDVRDLAAPTYRFQFVTDRVAAIARDAHVEFVDLFPALQGLTPEQVTNSAEDRHPNAEGHRRMAKALYEELRAIGVAGEGA